MTPEPLSMDILPEAVVEELPLLIDIDPVMPAELPVAISMLPVPP